MSDDIDIEEHDILDNPHIRSLFPDLSVVKKEISEFLSEPVNVKQEPELSQTTPKEREIRSSTPSASALNTLSNNNDTSSLGNNNSLTQKNVVATNTTIEFRPYQTNVTFQKNKIIIGSKPSKCETPKALENVPVKKQVRFPKLIVHDVKSYLEKNKRYCKACMILFPPNGELCTHKTRRVATENYTTETDLKTQECYKCRLCHINLSSKWNLTRHYKNIHKKILTFKSVNQMVKIETNNVKQVQRSETKMQSTYHCNVCKSTFSSLINLNRHNRNVHLDVEYKANESSSKCDSNGEIIRNTRANKTNKTDTECFHCNKIFPDNKSLIEHVYEILEPKSNKTTKDQNISKKKKNSETRSNLSKNDSREKKSTQQTEPKNVSNTFKQFKTQLKTKATTSSSNKVTKIKIQPKRKDKIVTKIREQKNESQNHPLERKVQLRSRNKNIDYKTEESESDESDSATPLSEINHNKSDKNIIKLPAKSKVSEKENVYVCPHCSYCFLIARNYIKHIKLKHKAKVPKLAKNVFDLRCKFCQARNTNIILHNRHLSKEHPDQLVKKVSQQKKVVKQLVKVKNSIKYSRAFVFKSVLFRCLRCDIHFISAEAAKDHDGHMEIMINWKCYICDQIFKKSDKKVHLKQHTFSNNITVQVLDAEGLSSILYKCTQCAIHFSEKSYLEHYEDCETKTAASVYCKVCDILINETDLNAHESSHNNVEDFSLNVIASDIIFFEELACESERRKKIVDHKSPETPKKVLNETLVYCPTCECFMTHVRKIHSNRLCGRLVNHVCDICGIVMTPKGIDTHRKYHKVKNFNLQDLTFLNMDGKVIKPPIPAYPQCSICKIYFTSRVVIIGHVCNDTQYLTCEICQINLTNDAFKLHMHYHAYTLQKKNKITVKLPKSDKNAVTSLPLNKADSIKSTSNNTTLASVRPDIAVKLKNKPNNIITEKSPNNSPDSLKKNEVVHESIGRQSRIHNAEMEQTQNAPSDDIDFEVIYLCTTCHVSVDSYDKVVEHCFNHKQPPLSLKQCSICNLKFDTTVDNHKHVDTRKPFKKISFDVKYFSFDSNVWQNHVFQSLNAKEISQIIGKSIYKDEHRLKFQILQPGPHHLTVYKCAKCNNIIEAENIFKHAGCTDANIRNIACSRCGLTFITNSSRNQHQSIHLRYNGINLNSYNIVLFNHESQQISNFKITDPSNYVLYQCRNCHGLVEKSDEEHQCDVNDLKKCNDCGLLLYVKDFSNHVKEHRSSPKFRTKNMKVILTGIRKETEVIDSKTLTPSYNGLMYDYTLYQCRHCKICVKNEQLIAKHVCILGIYRFKCHKCDFYFTEKAFKPHLKTHSIDLDFNKNNINIVHFDLKLANANVNDEVKNKCDDSKEQDNKESENDNQENNNSVGISNESLNDVTNAVTLFKCKCELHFVDKLNAIEHSKKCFPNQKISKQLCSKCNLLFNPSELFTHLVNHHGDKTVSYKLNIVEITDKITDSLEENNLYKCSKCTLHFCIKDVADSHFIVCEGVMMIDSEECKKCNITFDKESFNLEGHAVVCGKEYQILLVDETNRNIPSKSIETPTV